MKPHLRHTSRSAGHLQLVVVGRSASASYAARVGTVAVPPPSNTAAFASFYCVFLLSISWVTLIGLTHKTTAAGSAGVQVWHCSQPSSCGMLPLLCLSATSWNITVCLQCKPALGRAIVLCIRSAALHAISVVAAVIAVCCCRLQTLTACQHLTVR